MPKTSAAKKTHRTSVRLDADMPRWLVREAKRRHLPPSTVIRALLREAMSKPPRSAAVLLGIEELTDPQMHDADMVLRVVDHSTLEVLKSRYTHDGVFKKG